MPKVHIGKKIKDVLDKLPMTVVAFAEKINISRDGANKIFKKTTISADQLQKISQVLDHDFFTYYSPSLKDKSNSYGFATKDEVENLTKVVHTLALEIKKLREELPKTKMRKAGAKKSK